MRNKRTLIFISGSGTNMEAIVKGAKGIDIIKVIADRDCFGVTRAENLGVRALTLKDNFFEQASEIIRKENIELILLAGFLKILPADFIESAPPILNIHPSLLPKHGGKGCYGEHVHKMVYADKDDYSGATVHLVNDSIDGGTIIMQSFVSVKGLKPEEIQKKVLKTEHQVYNLAISSFIRGYEQ